MFTKIKAAAALALAAILEAAVSGLVQGDFTNLDNWKLAIGAGAAAAIAYLIPELRGYGRGVPTEPVPTPPGFGERA